MVPNPGATIPAMTNSTTGISFGLVGDLIVSAIVICFIAIIIYHIIKDT